MTQEWYKGVEILTGWGGHTVSIAPPLARPLSQGFPGGSAGTEPACGAGDMGSTPGLGGSPGEGNHS